MIARRVKNASRKRGSDVDRLDLAAGVARLGRAALNGSSLALDEGVVVGRSGSLSSFILDSIFMASNCCLARLNSYCIASSRSSYDTSLSTASCDDRFSASDSSIDSTLIFDSRLEIASSVC